MQRDIVSTTSAPAAIGPYSQGVKASGKFLYTAGQIPLDPSTMEVVGTTAAEQCKQVMKNLQAILTAAGTDFDHVIKTTIFLKSMSDFAAVNEVYGRHFTSHYPARATVAVVGLPKGAAVEMDAVAVVPGAG